ncbi:MAG: flavodoxin-dependent (E)-4-hydroxy-3-methylbut-2-enyl-diphosphate synthase [Verrucomicrobia bacterium]|nr:flavodoxin-dependent (E)-4-hydroxy-3-methylbut-2-enyl-diphosphate synthase [Verrucomicrobiota bacterium]
MERRTTRQVHVGRVAIGGGAPVSVQSMTTMPTADARATLAQIERLAIAGCEIVRCAVPDDEAAATLAEIVRHSPVPVVADIHFRAALALKAIEAGVHKVRLNPGNTRKPDDVRAVVRAAGEAGIPVRVGANSGSILHRSERARLAGARAATEVMVQRVADYVALIEDAGFRDLVISLKASSVVETIAAYRLMAAQCDYPLHLGVTAAGTPRTGVARSAVGLGVLLAEGIGDTVRVSLTGDPVEEIHAARAILEALELRRFGPLVVSCPTCGRTKADIVAIAQQVEARLAGFSLPVTVAVMGCEVNGPGEAAEADVGIAAAGDGMGTLFRRGEAVRRVREEAFVDELVAEVERLSTERADSEQAR